MANRVGQQLGNYRLIQYLDGGGFADVYLGEHIYLDTQAAIKVLHTHLGKADIENFLQEAKRIARLIHPHIVRVLEFGIEDRMPFLVLDYAPNGSLRKCHSKGTQLPLTTILSYVEQIASALQHAHNAELVHRDIKPENMLLGSHNEVLLSDFGIATITNTVNPRQQGTAGTIYYMAPEQIRGDPHRASDQYALGVVVYEWLCGERPFQGTWAEIAAQHQNTPPPPLSQKLTAVLPAVEQVVLKAMAKKIEDRFESVQAFAAALEKASELPGEEYYPEHVAHAMRECYYQCYDGADWGEMKEIGSDGARELQHELLDRRQPTVGYRRPFTNGAIYWSKRGGAQPIWGGFNQIHNNEGGAEGILGFPLTAELRAEPSPTYQTEGVFQRFEGQWDYPEDVNTTPIQRCGASLYCSKHGAYPTWGGIGICYERQWGTAGTLGFPTSDEIDVGPSPHGTEGKCQRFEGGSIYWSWHTEAHPIKREIANLYDSLNGVGGRLGFPLSGEHTAHPSPQGSTGTFQRFEGGLHDALPLGDQWDYSKGVPVYSSKHGVYPVWGGIRICYERLGNTGGVLGFPISLETEAARSPQGTTGWYQRFEGGIIFWCENYGGVPVVGSFLALYDEFGGTEGRFGFPKSPERLAEGHRQMLLQEFEGGVICVVQ